MSTSPATARRAFLTVSGFTLIELLVVISIISLLVAMLLPALGSARSAAQAQACMAQVRQIGMSATMYGMDWLDSTVPWNAPYGDSTNHGESKIFPGWRWGIWMDLTYLYNNDKKLYACTSEVRRGTSVISGLGYATSPWVTVQSASYEGAASAAGRVAGTPRKTSEYIKPSLKVYYGDSGYTLQYYAGRAPVGEMYSPFFQVSGEATNYDGVVPSARHLAPANQLHTPQQGPSGGGSNMVFFDGHAEFMAWKEIVPILHYSTASKYWKPWQ